MIRSVLILLVLMSTAWGEIVFGLASVAMKDDVVTIEKWRQYLSLKTGEKVRLVFTKNYDEMRSLLESGSIDVAYLCGATYVESQKSAKLDILAVPTLNGSPTYFSYVIARNNCPCRSLLDFKGKLYAYSDPKSNSGSIVPKYELLKRGINPREFFKKTITTYDHAESIHAVAVGFVDGASVDSIVYDAFVRLNPDIAQTIRIVQKIGPFPSTPVVVREALSSQLKNRLRFAMTTMHIDPLGKKILFRLGIEKFEYHPPYDYSPIAQMIESLKKASNVSQ